MKDLTKKVVLITGASSGFGYDAAKLLRDKGLIVYGVARREEKLKELNEYGIKTYKLDVTDYEESQNVVNDILAKEGRIDILVNNAGYGELGPIEVVSIENAKRQMEINVFAMANMCKLVIPSMREHKSGRIINISSVVGRMTAYYGGWYNISKFAVEALTDSLRMDLRKFGISVTAIEPGPFKTNWGIIASKNIIESTKGTVYESDGLSVANFYKVGYSKENFFIKDPIKVSKKIAKVAIKKHIKPRYLVGRFTRFMVYGSKMLPTKLADKAKAAARKK